MEIQRLQEKKEMQYRFSYATSIFSFNKKPEGQHDNPGPYQLRLFRADQRRALSISLTPRRDRRNYESVDMANRSSSQLLNFFKCV